VASEPQAFRPARYASIMDHDHRALAISTYNRCWEILDGDDRSDAVMDELVGCAFTSRHHWGIAGGLQEVVIGDWMIGRAAAEASISRPAVFGPLAWAFAMAAEETAFPERPDWLHASVAEGLARVATVLGDDALRAQWLGEAKMRVAAIADPDDRAVIAVQLDELRENEVR